MSWHAYAHTRCIKVRTLEVIFGRQMGATKEPLTRQNTLPNSTHIHTHPGGGKTQSNKQFEKLELDFAEKEEAVEGSFLTNQCTMEHMRT